MHLLAFDTCGAGCSVALLEDDRVLRLASENEPGKHVEAIFSLAETVLSKENLTYRDVDCFACTSGPGSFTGVRIGLAAVRGLTFALQAPALALTTLHAAAYDAACAHGAPGEIAVLLDARRDAWYFQRFHCPADSAPVPLGEAILLESAQLPGVIRQEETVFSDHPKLLQSHLHRDILNSAAVTVNADVAGRLGYRLFHAGGDNQPPLLPVYVRAADAKIPGNKALL